MLTPDELRDAGHLTVCASDHAAALDHRTDGYRRVAAVLGLLYDALEAYDAEARRPEPRLDCLATMVRAGVGALRERLYGEGEARR